MIYKVVHAHSPEELGDLVTKELSAGWSLQGGIAMTINSATSGGALVQVKPDLVINITEFGNNLVFCQAMIR